MTRAAGTSPRNGTVVNDHGDSHRGERLSDTQRGAELLHLAQAALAGQPISDLMDLVLRIALSALGADLGTIIEATDAGLFIRAHRGFMAPPDTSRPLGAGSVPDRVTKSNAPLIIDDYSHEPGGRPHPILIADGVVSSVGVPIGSKSEVGGVLAVHRRVAHGFTTADVQFIHILGNMLWLAIHRHDVEQSLIESNHQRQQLLGRLITAQENERRQIAIDIHDDAVQVMTAANLRLQLLRQHLAGNEGQLAIARRLQETVSLSIARLRSLLFELSPPALTKYGLASALRMHLAQYKAESAFDSVLECDFPDGQFSANTRIVVYRIVQEALSNVRKHAAASHVTVALSLVDGGCRGMVTDNGQGLPPGASEGIIGHLGITSMRERAQLAGGWWTIVGPPHVGTTVEFWVPDQGEADGDL